MDRILKIQKKENGPRASSAPALEFNTIIFIHVYWYMQQISGERLQDHWSSGLIFALKHRLWVMVRTAPLRRFYCVPTICVLSKNKKNLKNFCTENFQFLQLKKPLYTAWACFCNVNQKLDFKMCVLADFVKFP